MSESLRIYKCADCDMLVQALGACTCGSCDLSCGGNPMEALVENTVDAAKEKHVPVIEKIDGGYKVTVGSVPHPMEETHWITMIQLIAGKKVYTQFLDPGDAPEAIFMIDADEVSAREYCNLHGLWKA